MTRVALVIANDDYADEGLRQLAAPGRDAEALANVLGDATVGDFDVRTLRNASAQEIRLAVEDFFADRSPQDLLVLHFSCHGLKNSAGELFLASADTRPTRLASTAVAADFVNRQMAESRAQRIALFLDCCYGGAFPRGMVVRSGPTADVRGAFAGQQDVGGGRGRVIVTASSAMEYSFEGDQLSADSEPGPSVFTEALVHGLTSGDADRDGDGWVGLTELYSFVSERVREQLPQQNPQMWTFGAQGDMHIARTRVRRVVAGALPPELAESLASPLSHVRFGAVDELQERLHGANLSQALAAFAALKPVVEDDSRRVADAAARALASAELVITPPELELAAIGDTATLQLAGPPLATVATASSTDPFLHIEQDGPTVRVRAIARPESGADDDAAGPITFVGPMGEHTVSVHRQPQPAPPKTRSKAAAKASPAPVGPPAEPKPLLAAPQPQPAPPPIPPPAPVSSVPTSAPTVRAESGADPAAAAEAFDRRSRMLLAGAFVAAVLVLFGLSETSPDLYPTTAAALVVTGYGVIRPRRSPLLSGALLAASFGIIGDVITMLATAWFWYREKSTDSKVLAAAGAVAFAVLILAFVLLPPRHRRIERAPAGYCWIAAITLTATGVLTEFSQSAINDMWCNYYGSSGCGRIAVSLYLPEALILGCSVFGAALALVVALITQHRNWVLGAGAAGIFFCITIAAAFWSSIANYPSDAYSDTTHNTTYLTIAAAVAVVAAVALIRAQPQPPGASADADEGRDVIAR